MSRWTPTNCSFEILTLDENMNSFYEEMLIYELVSQVSQSANHGQEVGKSLS